MIGSAWTLIKMWMTPKPSCLIIRNIDFRAEEQKIKCNVASKKNPPYLSFYGVHAKLSPFIGPKPHWLRGPHNLYSVQQPVLTPLIQVISQNNPRFNWVKKQRDLTIKITEYGKCEVWNMTWHNKKTFKIKHQTMTVFILSLITRLRVCYVSVYKSTSNCKYNINVKIMVYMFST